MKSDTVLLIDGMNAFIRSYSAFPSMSTHGYQMGGTIGFLKTLARLVREICPKKVYVIWEGGGSTRRRSILPEYKANRKPEKLNRFYEDDIPDTDENRKHQLITLIKMMKHVPVCQLYTSDCEGDDVIGYLCRQKFRENNKIIVSSDRDMYQLLDEKTKVYNLHKKKYFTTKDVYTEYRIHSHNFAIAKSFCGDTSDNIAGVAGLGFKKLVKEVPLITTECEILLSEAIDYCIANANSSKLKKKIVENIDVIKRNWKLVYLDGSMLSYTQTNHIEQQMSEFKPHSDRMKLMKTLISEGIGDFDIPGFYSSFISIENVIL
jgi:DNA polymerase-1